MCATCLSLSVALPWVTPHAGSLVHACEEMWLPLVQTGNIYTFPGIPWLLQKMLRIHAHLFAGGTPWTRKQVGDVAERL